MKIYFIVVICKCWKCISSKSILTEVSNYTIFGDDILHDPGGSSQNHFTLIRRYCVLLVQPNFIKENSWICHWISISISYEHPILLLCGIRARCDFSQIDICPLCHLVLQSICSAFSHGDADAAIWRHNVYWYFLCNMVFNFQVDFQSHILMHLKRCDAMAFVLLLLQLVLFLSMGWQFRRDAATCVSKRNTENGELSSGQEIGI